MCGVYGISRVGRISIEMGREIRRMGGGMSMTGRMGR